MKMCSSPDIHSQMALSGIPDNIKEFIFEFIDSVEQLDILLLMNSKSNESLTAAKISAELRLNVSSVTNRLNIFAKQNLIVPGNNPEEFRINNQNKDLSKILLELNEAYRVRPARIFELIFSPLKKARPFASAFHVSTKIKVDAGDDNG